MKFHKTLIQMKGSRNKGSSPQVRHAIYMNKGLITHRSV